MYLPLLNALKTFVVAAYRLNFTKASEDLLVSPSAISHQIRILEDYLGFKLFFRKNRSLALTQEGQILYQSLEEPFNQINKALQNFLSRKEKTHLNISLRPFLSGTWLAGKLSDFWAKYPSIGINLIHNIEIPDFLQSNINLAIIWGKGDWSNLTYIRLIPGDLTPICSAHYLEKHGRPSSPEQLREHLLIHDEDHTAWSAWFLKTTGDKSFSKKGLNIDDTNVRLQAIKNDQGVMLGCPYLLKPQLESGSLVRLFDACLDDYSYYLAYPKNVVLSEKEQLFFDWLVEEAKK